MQLKRITPDTAARLTALVIGPAGAGKTSLTRTIPKGEKAIVLSAESGLLCIHDMIVSGQVEAFEIGSMADLRSAFEYLDTPEAKAQYTWVVLDSLTEISSRCLTAMREKYPEGSNNYKLWGDYAEAMNAMIRAFRDLSPYNVLFTCLEKVELDDRKRRTYEPMMSGNATKQILTSFFDLVFYYKVDVPIDGGGTKRMLVTQPVDGYPAKDRSGKLELLEEPNLSMIKNKIFNIKKGK